MLRALIDWNSRAARALDRVFWPETWTTSAVGEFEHRIVPGLLQPGMYIWDVGCGSRPLVQRAFKAKLGLTIVALDVDRAELEMMAPGLCDRVVVADLCKYRGEGCADLVLCRTVLEHVSDAGLAFCGLASIVRPGGIIAICAPCRNTLFARLNLLLPESVKKRILYSIWPQKANGHSGFPARYHRCTPNDFTMMAREHGLRPRELRTYWWSSYFTFLLPVWAAWRVYQLFARLAIGNQAAEAFVLIAERPAADSDARAPRPAEPDGSASR